MIPNLSIIVSLTSISNWLACSLKQLLTSSWASFWFVDLATQYWADWESDNKKHQDLPTHQAKPALYTQLGQLQDTDRPIKLAHRRSGLLGMTRPLYCVFLPWLARPSFCVVEAVLWLADCISKSPNLEGAFLSRRYKKGRREQPCMRPIDRQTAR